MKTCWDPPSIKIHDVYGCYLDAVRKHKGYKEVDFRPVKPGDTYLDPQGEVNSYEKDGRYLLKNVPRIILELVPVRKRYIYEETGDAPRPLKSGEFGLCGKLGNQVFYCEGAPSIYEYKPLTLRVEDIPC